MYMVNWLFYDLYAVKIKVLLANKIVLMLKESRHSVLQSNSNYIFLELKRLKQLASA